MNAHVKEPTSSIPIEHAWNWFDFHAAQRLTMIRFYIMVLGALGGGVGYVYHERLFLISAVLSALGMMSAYCFNRLDRRVADLVKLGEGALKHFEEAFANQNNNGAMKICELADAPEKRGHYPYSYRENLSLLLWSSFIVFTLILIVSIMSVWLDHDVTTLRLYNCSIRYAS
jgi:hypothetical protein